MRECAGRDDLRAHGAGARYLGRSDGLCCGENIPECRSLHTVTRGLANNGRLVACGPGMSATRGGWERDDSAPPPGSLARGLSLQYLPCIEAYYDDEHHR